MTYKRKITRKTTRKKRKYNIKHRQSGGNISSKDANLALCVYAHSDVFDPLEIQFDYLSKLFQNDSQKIYLFSNKNYDRPTSLKYETILYDDSMLYTKRIQSCIEKVKEDYLIILQEKNILLKYSKDAMNKLVNTMQMRNIDSIDLKKRADCISDISANDVQLSNIANKDFTFNHQPRLWKKTSALAMFSSNNGKTYGDAEDNDMQSFIKNNQKTYGLCPINSVDTILGFHVSHDFMYMPVTTANKFIITPRDKLDKIIEDEFKKVYNKYIIHSNFAK
jgi:hypothetical protein